MSNHDHWMPLYVGDYLADTMELNAAQHGAYLLLLMYYWRNGPLPADDGKLAAIARTERKVWDRQIGPVVKAFFRLEGGRLHQKRADLELAKADEAKERTQQDRQAAADRMRRLRASRNGEDPPPGGDANVRRTFSEHSPNSSVTEAERSDFPPDPLSSHSHSQKPTPNPSRRAGGDAPPVRANKSEQLAPGNRRDFGTNPRYTGKNSRADDANPRATATNPRVLGTNPRGRPASRCGFHDIHHESAMAQPVVLTATAEDVKTSNIYLLRLRAERGTEEEPTDG